MSALDCAWRTLVAAHAFLAELRRGDPDLADRLAEPQLLVVIAEA
jgi:hypothetical protein